MNENVIHITAAINTNIYQVSIFVNVIMCGQYMSKCVVFKHLISIWILRQKTYHRYNFFMIFFIVVILKYLYVDNIFMQYS